MDFTTLVFFSLFTVFNSRSDKESAFRGLFSNGWLWGAVLFSLLLQVAVIYIPVLQQAFSTVSLSFNDWLLRTAVASSVLGISVRANAIKRTWCLFGVYYRSAPVRGEGISETKEKSSKCTGNNYLRGNSLLAAVDQKKQ